MTRAEYLIALLEEINLHGKDAQLKKQKLLKKQQKIHSRDVRDVRALNKAFGTQFGVMGAAGLHKAHKAAKSAGLYEPLKRKVGLH